MSFLEIRLPAPIDFSEQRLRAGDTHQFISKLNDTQAKLEAFSAQLVLLVEDLEPITDVAKLAQVQDAAADLEVVRTFMDASLNPVVKDALDRINSAEPITQANLHALALYF